MSRLGTNLEQTLAAAVELHAEADAARFAGAGELAEQSGQDRAGQRLLRQRGQRLGLTLTHHQAPVRGRWLDAHL